MAEVYLAEHLLLNRMFALKVMRDRDMPQTDRDVFQQRFLREAKLTYSLDHPAVVRVFDAGCDLNSGLLFIVMEYVEGRTLESFIPEQQSADFLLKTADAIAQALILLEEKQIIHRDIKPSNIIVCEDGSFKLMDLGIARAVNHADGCLTVTMERSVVGTPAYSSPEQCQDSHRIDIRSDIYSLGATLYHLASGKPPFQGDTAIKLILNVMQTRPEPLSGIRPDLPRPLIDLIEYMMQKDPDKRPRNAVELLEAVRRVEQGKKPCGGKAAGIFLLAGAAAAGLLICIAAAVGIVMHDRTQPEKKPVPVSKPVPIPEPVPMVKAALPAVQATPPVTPLPSPPKPEPAPPKPQPAVSSAPEQINVPVRKAEKIIFRQRDFILPGRPRTLENRLDEIRRILKFLRSKESAGLSLREDRVKLFTERAAFLEKMLKRRNNWRKRIKHVPPPEGIRSELEDFLKQNPPMIQIRHTGRCFTSRLIPLLQRRQMDPESRFRDYYGEERPLIGLARFHFLEHGYSLVPALAMAGADLDAYPGTPKKPIAPSTSSPQMRTRMQQMAELNFLAYYIEFGGNNVDYSDGVSVLLKFMNSITFPSIRNRKRFPHGDFVHFLLDCHGILDVTDGNGRSPVHIAALHDRPDLLEKILLAGIDQPGRADNSGNTAYLYAVRNHLPRVVRVLEKYGIKSALSPKDAVQGELLQGLNENDPERILQSVKNGASLRYVYRNGSNILQLAVLQNKPEMVRLLLDQGVNVHWNQEQISVILLAVKTKKPAIFELLVKSCSPLKLNVHSCGHYHWLPEYVLQWCAGEAQTAVQFYEILLKNGWDINASGGPFRRTVLHSAAVNRKTDPELIRFLLKKGANPAVTDSSGRTPGDLASKPEIKEILRLAQVNGSQSE